MYHRKNLKGQFFSLDVIAGSLIFMVAFFILAFYWLNAQAGMGEKTDDLQGEAERIAGQLMTPGQVLPLPNGWMAAYWNSITAGNVYDHIDQYGVVPYIHFVSDPQNPSELNIILLRDLKWMNYSAQLGQYYPEVKDKLGIPRYEFYIAVEDENGDLFSCGSGLFSFDTSLAGIQPTSGASEVANAERIVLIDCPPGDGVPHQLAKLRVQVWRP